MPSSTPKKSSSKRGHAHSSKKKVLSVSTASSSTHHVAGVHYQQMASAISQQQHGDIPSPSFHIQTQVDSMPQQHVYHHGNATPLGSGGSFQSPHSRGGINAASCGSNGSTHSRISSLGSAHTTGSNNSLSPHSSRGSYSSTTSGGQPKRHNYFIASSDSPQAHLYTINSSPIPPSSSASVGVSATISGRGSAGSAGSSSGSHKKSKGSSSGRSKSRGKSGIRRRRPKKSTVESPQTKMHPRSVISSHHQSRMVASPQQPRSAERRIPSSPKSPTAPNTTVRRIRTASNAGGTISPSTTASITRVSAVNSAVNANTRNSRSTGNSESSSPLSPRFVINTAATVSAISIDSQESDESNPPGPSTQNSNSMTATPSTNRDDTSQKASISSPNHARPRSNSESQRSNDGRYNIAYYPGQQHLFKSVDGNSFVGEDKNTATRHSSEQGNADRNSQHQNESKPPTTPLTSTSWSEDSRFNFSPNDKRQSVDSSEDVAPPSPFLRASARSHTGSTHLSRPSSVNRYSHSSSRSSASVSRSAHYNSIGHHNPHSSHSSFARGGALHLHSSFRSSSASTHYSPHNFSAHQPTLNLLDSTPLPHMHNSIPVCTIDQSRHLPHLVSRNFLHFVQYDYNTDTWNELGKPPRKRRKSFMLHQAANSARRETALSVVCRKETMNQNERLYVVSSMRKTSILEYDFSNNKWKKFKLNGLSKELKKKGPFFPGHTIVYDEHTDQSFLFGGFEKRLQAKDRKSSDANTNSLFRINFKTRVYEELNVPQKDDFGIILAPVLRSHHSACLWVPSMDAASEILQQQQKETGTPSSIDSEQHSSFHHRSLSNSETPNSMSMRYMVVFGGESLSGIILKDVWLFDLKTLKWSKMESTNPCTISRGSKGHRACCVGDKMFVACTQVMSTSFDTENPEPCTFLSMHQLDLRTRTWSYIDLSISISAQTICGLFCIPFETLKYPYPSCIIVTDSGLHILSQGNRRGSAKKSQRKIRTVSLISATSNSSRESKEEEVIIDENSSPTPFKRQRSHSTPTWKPSHQSDSSFTNSYHSGHVVGSANSPSSPSTPMSPGGITTGSIATAVNVGRPNRPVVAPLQDSQTASDFSDLTSSGSMEESSNSSASAANALKQASALQAAKHTATRDSLTSLDSHPSSEDKNVRGSIFNKVTIERLNPQLAKFLYNFQQQERRLSLQKAESLDTRIPSRPQLKRKSSRFMVNGQDGKTYTVEIIGDQEGTPETIPSGNMPAVKTPAPALGNFGIGFDLNSTAGAEDIPNQGAPIDLKIQFNIDPNSKTGQGMTFKTESGTFFCHDIRITEHGITSVPRSMRLSMRKSYRNSTMQALLEREEYNIDFDDLEEIRQLGYGASSKVFLVQHRETGKEYAMKVMGCEEDFQPELIISEIKAFFRCRKSPYIVSFHQAYYIEQEIHMLLEYLDEGSLGDSISTHGRMPEAVIGCIAVRVLKGLIHLHEKRIIHRDIKPENILFNKKGMVKIGDFGLIGYKDSRMSIRHSFESETTHFDTPKGTYVYMSPERFEGRKYSYNSDVWSFGMTLVKLRTGQLPFETCGSYWKLVQEMKTIRNLTLDTSVFSKGFSDLIYKCIIFDPHKRPTSAELLNDPWIQHFEQMGDEENAKNLAKWVSILHSEKGSQHK
uniref:mitogen-activated protein kinase kinase n=1 Tax=Percolomonas cosmopolitus TaxID=63605 RepID=A0A7S1KPD3_9EUKA|mmetsp:Transcript_3901/g.14731  ORF Transcript_3901/g.14731 Transcript_3901/m.14731 type:complete len:1648 (+) Transcript_3901:356-5299(+)|eukprot:CAMPEP_0117438656 /NCGR_PEP_ID=MMETSP0759-20121206/2165_1 /TAXON_ID=63605 /ORGANISM="Percolomonas cosmopolitus, Strain WS" /LENGTH=1647 /DNA_ID=CAMNT_0005230353 /DNA_START=986 /DNA_END=5929 /DNA_ORIENTATION=-